jgi:DNA mismatch repair protein MutS2
MTLLVEPPKLREIASKRIQLLAKQEEILNQIFVELSSVLTENYSDFGEIISIVSKIDLLVSKASFCQEHQLSRPEISNSGDIYIKSFFHPLLDSPVTNDLSLKSSNAGLVISGPNTGGKTVALKSLAMCQILLHAGLFLPAQVATLPIARAVYYFSHDQQDLGQGLSSFSSEALQYIQLAENLEDQSFVFIDEIFNSTSSEEASALALGLLDYINENRDVKIFLSTHHQFLKTAMHADKKYLSCHVGYDFEKNSPTYKLQYHSPGSSLALSIFQKLTQNARTDLTSIFSKAKGYLDKKQVSYESLLEKLSAQKTELNKKIDEVNQLQHELKHQKKSSEGILYLEREKIREDFKLQLEKKFSEAKAWLQTFKQEIKHSGNVNKAFSKLEKQKDKHLVGFKKNKEMSKLNFNNDNEKLSISDITTGEFYFCTLTNSDVPISKVNVRKKQLQIKNKGISFWVPLSSLSQSSQKRKPQPQEIKVTVQKSEVGQVEIDGRGLRLEEFQRVVLPSLDELLCEDIPYLTVIHGHGDGILKNWLRNHLSKNQSDFDWGPDEGNDGSTTIKVSN